MRLSEGSVRVGRVRAASLGRTCQLSLSLEAGVAGVQDRVTPFPTAAADRLVGHSDPWGQDPDPPSGCRVHHASAPHGQGAWAHHPRGPLPKRSTPS